MLHCELIHKEITSERFELILQVKLLSPRPGQVNAEIGTDGVLLQRPAHLVDPLHHRVWRWTCQRQRE